MKEMWEGVKASQFQDPMRVAHEAMKAFQFHDPMQGMQEGLKALQFLDSNSMKVARDAMKALQFHDPTQGMRGVMGALQIDGLVGAMSAREWPLAYGNLDADIVIRDENTIAVGSTTLTRSEVQSLVDQITDRAFAQPEDRLEQAVAVIVAEIASLRNRNPKLERLLTYLIFPIIVAVIFSIINPIADYYIKEALSANDRQMKKSIRKHVLTSVDDSV